MSELQHTYGWEAIGGHNRGGKPKELRDAEEEADSAWSRFSIALDNYYDRHYGEPEWWQMCKVLRETAENADALVMKLAVKHGWRQAPDAHLEERYEMQTDLDF